MTNDQFSIQAQIPNKLLENCFILYYHWPLGIGNWELIL